MANIVKIRCIAILRYHVNGSSLYIRKGSKVYVQTIGWIKGEDTIMPVARIDDDLDKMLKDIQKELDVSSTTASKLLSQKIKKGKKVEDEDDYILKGLI
jgi:hypothetical protein